MPLVLLLLGIPIFLLVLTTCITAVVFFSKLPHTVLHQVLFDALDKFPLIAVPFFLFTGDLMSRGGLSTRLMRWVASMVGGFRGKPAADLARLCRDVRRDLGRHHRLGRGGRLDHLSAPARRPATASASRPR